MKKGYSGRFANDPISKTQRLTPINGPVTEYQLTPEELAYYRNLKPETDDLGLPLRRGITQNTRHKGA